MLTVLVGLVVAELLLRGVWGLGNPRIVETSARVGYRFYPGQVIAGPRGTTERLNESGYRDDEWAASAPLRIAVCGASVSYGTGVEAEASWPQLLERELEGVDVVNLAMPGYVLGQIEPQYEDDVRPLAPDVVVLELGPYSALPAPVRTDSARYPLHTWIRRSALFDLVRRRADAAGFDPERSRLAVLDPEEQVASELDRAAQARLDRLAATIEADGAQLVLLETPILGAVLTNRQEPGVWEDWAARHPDVPRIRTVEPLRAAMGELLAEIEREGLSPERVWNRFEAPIEVEHGAASVFFRDDPLHLNEHGHRVVAGIVRDALRDAQLW